MIDLMTCLRSFVAVTQTGSFSAVARREGTSQSAVTRRIAELEAHFGVRLLHRTTRRVSLTPDGEDLLVHARTVLDAAEEMEVALGLHRTDVVGQVRVGAPVGFGNFLADKLPDLLARHEGLTVELVLQDEISDMVAARLDIAVCVRPLQDSSLVVRQIGEIGWLTVAAPDYLARQGAPAHPSDLGDHVCLVHTTSRGTTWHFTGPRGTADIAVRAPFAANVTEAVQRAAIAGLGIALLPDLQLVDDLQAGRLVRVLPDWEAPRIPIYIATPTRRHLPPRTRVVMDFIVAQRQRLRERVDSLRVLKSAATARSRTAP